MQAERQRAKTKVREMMYSEVGMCVCPCAGGYGCGWVGVCMCVRVHVCVGIRGNFCLLE
jgi:hypothetical protein